MDTKEKKPVRRSGDRRPAAPQRGSAPERRRRTAPPSKTRAAGNNRVVRPPREDVPEVVYSMPKPVRKGQFLLRLVTVVAVVMAAVLALSVFFRVDTVQVSGMEKYTPWMIREASGIEDGDALLGVNKAKVAGRIIAKLPYVDKVKIGIILPGTVNIEITELKVTYAIQAGDSTWWLVTSDGRVVEQIDVTAASNYTRIIGVQVNSPQEGQTIHAVQTVQTEQQPEQPTDQTEPDEQTDASQPVDNTEETESTDSTEDTEQTEQTQTDQSTQPSKQSQTSQSGVDLTAPTLPQVTEEQKLQIALEMIQNLEKNEIFGQISSIDVSDASDLTMQYGQRFRVMLGDWERLDYKIRYMAQAVKQLQPNDAGELDLSFRFSEEALFTPAT